MSKWIDVELGDIARVTSGGTPDRKTPHYWNGTIPWITTSQITFNKISGASEFITEEGLENSSAKIFPINTILMAMYGQGQTRGRVSILGIEAATNQACAAIIVNDKAYFEYVFYYLQSQYKQIREIGHGGNQINLNGEIIKSISIPLPPLHEQRAIAAILSTWDEAITLTTRLIDALQRRKQALMQLLLTGAVRFPGFDGAWEVSTLEEISALIESGGTPSTQNPDYWNGHIPWITGADFSDQAIGQIRRYITREAVQNSSTKIADAGDVLLVSRTGVGKMAIAPFEIAFSQDVTRVVPDTSKISPTFLLHYVANSILNLSKFNQGTSINGVTRKDLVSIVVEHPEIGEQRLVSDVIELCRDQLGVVTSILNCISTQKRGLMQQLLSGAVRVGMDD
ncbi:MAG TPA: restriction endonuclease subunit S [Aggregatilineales bacterium]|nr:restriction endonuclease subunit S [Aggregatilineales bacterium]